MISTRLIVVLAIAAAVSTVAAHFSREDREYHARRDAFESCVDKASTDDDIRRCDRERRP